MNARTCMACGSDVAEDAERCNECGAELEPRRLHEGSDVRLEVERLGEVLVGRDTSLPAERWGRTSDHPKRLDEHGIVEPSAPSAEHAEPTQDHPRLDHAAPAALGTTTKARGLEDSADRSGDNGSHAAVPAGRVESPVPAPAAPTNGVELTTAATIEVIPKPPVAASERRPTGSEVALDRIATTGSQAALDRVTAPGAHGARPPVLASEALQRDLTPAEPAPQLLRFWAPVLGGIGVIGAWVLTHGRGLGVPLAGAFAALALLGLPRMPYGARAGAGATVAATGLALVLWADMGNPHAPKAVVLALTVTMLATGLFFRQWHRASALSRFIVTVGVALGAAFLWMSHALTELTMMDTAWQSWVPNAIVLPFGLLLMLSLLVFMNARTTAGAGAWGTFVLLWYGLHSTVEVLQAAWPKFAAEPDFSRLEVQAVLARASAPLFAALLALSLAQLIASSVGGASGAARPRQAYS